MDMETDQELERIEEELRRHDERRKRILERKARRIRQIRERQLKDKEVWMKRFIPLLDKTLTQRFGALFWYDCSVEEICLGISEMQMPTSGNTTGEAEEKAKSDATVPAFKDLIANDNAVQSAASTKKKNEEQDYEGQSRDEYH